VLKIVLFIGNECTSGAFGGIIVALVVKSADSIIKGFATSAAIILTSSLTYFLFSLDLTFVFVLGVTIVVLSIFNYNEDEKLSNSPPLPSIQLSSVAVAPPRNA